MTDGWGAGAEAFGRELSGEHEPGTLSESAILERFRARLDEAIADADDQGRSGAVVYVGLDGFRAVSSGLGREAAQAVLAALGQRLRHATRGESVVAHLGGDRFAVLLPPASQVQTLRSAEQLRQIVAVPIRLGDRLIVRHASAGVAIVRPRPVTADDLICEAESAVALAKLRGGDQVAMFDPRGHTGLQEDARLEVDLREALSRDELSLVFQPVVDLYDGRIVDARGARALEPPGARRDRRRPARRARRADGAAQPAGPVGAALRLRRRRGLARGRRRSAARQRERLAARAGAARLRAGGARDSQPRPG